MISEFNVVVPRLVVQEVTRNLDTTTQVRQFYRLLDETSYVAVVDEPVPRELVMKYVEQGLPEKADRWAGGSAVRTHPNPQILRRYVSAASHELFDYCPRMSHVTT